MPRELSAGSTLPRGDVGAPSKRQTRRPAAAVSRSRSLLRAMRLVPRQKGAARGPAPLGDGGARAREQAGSPAVTAPPAPSWPAHAQYAPAAAAAVPTLSSPWSQPNHPLSQYFLGNSRLKCSNEDLEDADTPVLQGGRVNRRVLLQSNRQGGSDLQSLCNEKTCNKKTNLRPLDVSSAESVASIPYRGILVSRVGNRWGKYWCRWRHRLREINGWRDNSWRNTGVYWRSRARIKSGDVNGAAEINQDSARKRDYKLSRPTHRNFGTQSLAAHLHSLSHKSR